MPGAIQAGTQKADGPTEPEFGEAKMVKHSQGVNYMGEGRGQGVRLPYLLPSPRHEGEARPTTHVQTCVGRSWSYSLAEGPGTSSDTKRGAGCMARGPLALGLQAQTLGSSGLAPPFPTHSFAHFRPAFRVRKSVGPWAGRQGPVTDLVGEVREVTAPCLTPHLYPF